jgi:hypothetical protein
LRYGERITSFVADAVDDNEYTIGLPPLHMHHVHVAQGGLRTHAYETHGDYGTYMLGARQRPTYAQAINSPYCRIHTGLSTMVNADVNDVRRPGVDADVAIGWKLRVKFHITSEPCVRVVKVILWYPCASGCEADRWRRYDVGNSPQGKLLWWHAEIPASLNAPVVQAWYHTHRARDAGVALLYGLHDINSTLKGVFSTVGDARDKILSRTRESLICTNDVDKPTVEHIRNPHNTTIPYDRAGALKCDHSRVLPPSSPLTVVAFISNRWAAEDNPFMQHTMLFLHIPSEHALSDGTDTFDISVSNRRYYEWVPGGAPRQHEITTAAFNT